MRQRRSRQRREAGLARLTLSSMNMMPIQTCDSPQKLGQPAHSGGQPGRITPVSASSANQMQPSARAAARRQRREQHRAHSAWPDHSLRLASRSASQHRRGWARGRALARCARPRCARWRERKAIQEPKSKKATLSSASTRRSLQCSRGAAPGVAAPSMSGRLSTLPVLVCQKPN